MSKDFLLLVFFHESVCPQPQSIPIGPFRIFSKIRGDICSSRLATGVADTGGKWKKSSIRKITLGSFRIFSKIRGDIRKSNCTTGVNHTGGKFDTGGKLPPVSTTPAANLPPVSTTPAANLPPVSLTQVVQFDLRISPRIFEKIRNDPNVIIRGLGEGDS